MTALTNDTNRVLRLIMTVTPLPWPQGLKYFRDL